MKQISRIVLIAILFALGECWVGIIPASNKTEHKGHCYTEYYKIGSMTYGEERKPANECLVVNCDKTGTMGITGCGVISAGPECQVLPGNVSKPYPDCCFEIKCNHIRDQN